MQAQEPETEVELDRLMRDYQAGHLEAFDEIFRALCGPIFQYLNARLLDPTRAEDLVQETFLQIHRSRATYRPGRSVRAWAFGVALRAFRAGKELRSILESQGVTAPGFPTNK